MTDDVNSKLDAIFNARAERLAAASHAKLEMEKKQDVNLQEFLALKASLIRPSFDALAQRLSDRGQESRVFETEDGDRVNGHAQEAKIGIRFLLDQEGRFGRGDEYPHLTLTFEKSSRKVHFYKSTMSSGKGGMSGSDGSVNLGSLTEDLINQKALKIIAEIYK